MKEKDQLFGQDDIAAMITAMAEKICGRPGLAPYLVGIRSGGEVLTRRLAEAIAHISGKRPQTGAIDIALYRDDWTRLHSAPRVGSTELAPDMAGRRVVLVDDVLYTGRTTRAAMDALIDFGRPARIELAVLVDRGGRELPIQADYAGAAVSCGDGEVIDVHLKDADMAGDAVLRRARS